MAPREIEEPSAFLPLRRRPSFGNAPARSKDDRADGGTSGQFEGASALHRSSTARQHVVDQPQVESRNVGRRPKRPVQVFPSLVQRQAGLRRGEAGSLQPLGLDRMAQRMGKILRLIESPPAFSSPVDRDRDQRIGASESSATDRFPHPGGHRGCQRPHAVELQPKDRLTGASLISRCDQNPVQRVVALVDLGSIFPADHARIANRTDGFRSQLSAKRAFGWVQGVEDSLKHADRSLPPVPQSAQWSRSRISSPS